MTCARSTRRRPVLVFLLLCVCLLTACGKAAPAPAPVSTPSPEPTVAALSPDDTVFTGPDGAVRASLAVQSVVSEREGKLRVDYRLANRGERAVTRVRFTLDGLDESGAVLNAAPVSVTCELMEDPLLVGEERSFSRTHYFTGAERTASVRLSPLSAEDETELAPWMEPQPNNLLPDFCNDPVLLARFAALEQDLPVTLIYEEDQVCTEYITDPELIWQVLEALRQVRIGALSDRNVDDGGFTYTFQMADGTSWGLRFDFKNLLYWHGRNYDVLDASALFAVELPDTGG